MYMHAGRGNPVETMTTGTGPGGGFAVGLWRDLNDLKTFDPKYMHQSVTAESLSGLYWCCGDELE